MGSSIAKRRLTQDLFFWLALLAISALVPFGLSTKKVTGSHPLPATPIAEQVSIDSAYPCVGTVLEVVISELQKDRPGQSLILTQFDHELTNIDEPTNRYGSLSPEFWQAWLAANESPCDLSTGVPGHNWITLQQRASIFPEGSGWKKFHQRYPGASGIVIVSCPGFDVAHTSCLVYGAFQSETISESAALYKLIGEANEWKIAETYPL